MRRLGMVLWLLSALAWPTVSCEAADCWDSEDPVFVSLSAKTRAQAIARMSKACPLHGVVDRLDRHHPQRDEQQPADQVAALRAAFEASLSALRDSEANQDRAELARKLGASAIAYVQSVRTREAKLSRAFEVTAATGSFAKTHAGDPREFLADWRTYRDYLLEPEKTGVQMAASARRALAEGRYDDCLAVLRPILRIDPSQASAEVLTMAGTCYGAKRAPQRAGLLASHALRRLRGGADDASLLYACAISNASDGRAFAQVCEELTFQECSVFYHHVRGRSRSVEQRVQPQR